MTKEWIISTEVDGAVGKEQGSFCKAGDSGSGVISNDGLICGLLHGAVTALCGMRVETVCGLCMQMPDVRNWVAARTGSAELGLP